MLPFSPASSAPDPTACKRPAGAGLNQHLGKKATVFSTYEITRPGGVPPAGARTPEETSTGGYDFTYGFRLPY